MINTSMAIKSFCKVTDVPASDVSAIQLMDSAGAVTLKCNYAEVVCLGDASGVVHLIPSSLSYQYENPGTNPVAPREDSDGAGGILCTVGQYSPQTYTIRTSGGEFFDTIQVTNLTSADIEVIINYGVIYTANPMDTLKVSNRGS